MDSPSPPQEDPQTKAERLREQARADAATLQSTQQRLIADTQIRRRIFGNLAALVPRGVPPGLGAQGVAPVQLASWFGARAVK